MKALGILMANIASSFYNQVWQNLISHFKRMCGNRRMRRGNLALFSAFKRTSMARANHDSSNYEFLDNSAWKAASYVRNKIIEWVCDFPLDKDFVARFTSHEDKEHAGAFFELVTFQFLRHLGYRVFFQLPSIAGSSRRPDFTVYRKRKEILIAECTLSGLPNHSPGIDRLENQIKDMIESVASPDYYINVDFERSGTISIAKNKIISFVKKVIAEGQTPVDSLHDVNHWTMEESGWKITVSLIPKPKESTRTLGINSSGGAEIIDSVSSLRNSLNRKRASKYGSLSLPYLICLNSFDFYMDEMDIMQALFYEDGFWKCNEKPQNRTVSALLLFKDLGRWNLNSARPILWHNPWAEYPLTTSILNVDQYIFTDTDRQFPTRKLINGRSFREILNIDNDYLSQEVSN
ncbi:MAG: hypothetical protein HOP08_18730 [Cyclobacteriaceae bacterium]|nr:hypothetical protein [Cyclobacteriaceae bacterium]